MRAALPLLLALLAGCATTAPVALGNDTYMLSQTSAGGVFKSMGSLKSEVIQRANAFAASKGKVAIAVSQQESPALPGRRMPNFEYQFKLVDANDPRAAGNAMTAQTGSIVEVRTPSTKPDTYTELLKLDDLHKRGILSDAEYQAQKAKLLSGQ